MVVLGEANSRVLLGLTHGSIAVYDVLLPLAPASSKPILVPQPPSHLPDLYSLHGKSCPVRNDILKQPLKTYIGAVSYPLVLPPSVSKMVEEIDENSSVHPANPHGQREDTLSESRQRKSVLYALSSTSYPLISLAPPPQPGSLTNGSFFLSDDLPERDQLLPYLLDPPLEEQSVKPAQPSGVNKYSGLWDKANPGRRWLWLVAGVLGGLVLCGLMIMGLVKRQSLRQAGSIQSDKTPPLVPSNATAFASKTAVVDEGLSIAETTSTPVSSVGDDALTQFQKKKASRRRVRGKKKRRGSESAFVEAEAEDDENDEGEDSVSLTTTYMAKGEKPLPDLPRELSSNGLHDFDNKEQLAISDVVIGQSFCRDDTS